jgi:hypothetical protein
MGDIQVVEETNGWENEVMKPSDVGGFFHHDLGNSPDLTIRIGASSLKNWGVSFNVSRINLIKS